MNIKTVMGYGLITMGVLNLGAGVLPPFTWYNIVVGLTVMFIGWSNLQMARKYNSDGSETQNPIVSEKPKRGSPDDLMTSPEEDRLEKIRNDLLNG